MYQFRQMAQVEEQNLSTVFRMGPIPGDDGLRKVLDGLDPERLRQGFVGLRKHLMGSAELAHCIL